jgi:enterochelin esterase-like enzyme
MEAVGLVPALDSLAAGGVIDPPIVVAVHAGDGRLQNYGTAGQPNAQGLGAGAADYERFLVRELLPLIERRYRVRAGGAAIMGWSLGGLSAFDLAWRNSSRFQRVGVFSGSFWWRTDDASVESRQSSRIVHRRVRNTAALPRLEIWLEAGLQDETADRDNNGVIDAIQDTRELIEILVGRGMKEGRELQYLELDGGHDLETWSQALPRFLAWAFPAGVRAPSHTTHRPAP